jgi:hypothetical protein
MNIKVKEHERLSNIAFRHKLKWERDNIATVIANVVLIGVAVGERDNIATVIANVVLIGVAVGERNKYKFYSLCFDPIGARTHYLPHSRQAC